MISIGSWARNACNATSKDRLNSRIFAEQGTVRTFPGVMNRPQMYRSVSPRQVTSRQRYKIRRNLTVEAPCRAADPSAVMEQIRV